MADYALHGLNTRDFQHMVQAIARKQVGAGVTAFGDGKDGNRDLTFTGKMCYPSITSPWNGYLVLGCKFCQRPSGDSKKDGNWAFEQLEADLKKFLNQERNLPRPEYYLFATNIPLTAVPAKGSRDRINALLSKYAQKLRLKAHGVWDYNDIRGFLDGDKDVRLAYGHLITAGDVLASVVQAMQSAQADFTDVMHSFLQKELIADAAAKLQSAGEDPELQIPLASVFIDLPYADTPEAATLAKSEDESKASKVVDQLLKASGLILRRRPEDELAHPDVENASTALPRARFVIVGGPGQGKSTLGQYLCQLHRAAILRDRPSERLDEHVLPIVRLLERQRHDMGGLPLARRFPIRLELRTLSIALASEPQLTLLEYICRDISRLGSSKVSTTDLKAWLANYPWLLVLDGLDEVPPSSNRADVMKQIEHFRVDAASQNADLMLVATTRPQSYSQEFAEDLFLHFYLMPLTPQHALNYGRRLAESRCGGDERRRDELVRSLEKACKNDATARLMQSPLQVTIMATLIEDTGEPPQQRFRLFAEYYRTIYKRETRRKLLAGILSERQTDVDTIHANTGLLLHIAGETTTHRAQAQGCDIESALSDEQFREVVRRRLDKLKVPPEKAADLLGRLTDSTLQRLVFLVRPREGWVRFDITSLKEFMAAEAVMTGTDAEVRQRLEVIAPATYWRNVFLFAVGKCFVQREHMLDAVVGICTDLNEEPAATRILGNELAGRGAKATLWGSRLALDVLADGTARQYPEYEVRLARLALDLVKVGDQEVLATLASVWHDDLSDLYRDVINDRFGQSSFWHTLGAWQLLLSLTDRGVLWARELCDKKWPTHSEHQATILQGREVSARRSWCVDKLFATASHMSPWWLRDFVHPARRNLDIHVPNAWQPIVEEFYFGRRSSIELLNRSRFADIIERFHLTPFRLDPAFADAIGRINFVHPDWLPLVAGARFAQNPNAGSLARELSWLAQKYTPRAQYVYGSVPWPLKACLSAAASREDLARMAKFAQIGGLGDTDDWSSAEERWARAGITDQDFDECADDHWPLAAEIGEVGFAFGAATRDVQRFPDSVVRTLNSICHGKLRSWFAASLLDAFLWPTLKRVRASRQDCIELFRLAHEYPEVGRWHKTFWLEGLQDGPSERLTDGEIDVLNWLGEEGYRPHSGHHRGRFADQLVHRFCSKPVKNQGLLPIIAAMASFGGQCVLPLDVLEEARSWNPQSKEDADTLYLGHAPLSDLQLLELAKTLGSGSSPATALSRGLRVAATVSPEQEAAFAIAILESISLESQEGRHAAEARRVLVEFLTRKPSAFDARGLCGGLSLPEFK